MTKLCAVASLLAMLAVETYAPHPTDACGIPVPMKNMRVRRAVAISSNHASVLLVGSELNRLEHDLSSAGHDVEVTTDQMKHKRTSYDVVAVASNEQAQAAHERFPDAVIVVRSGDVIADERSITGQASTVRVFTRRQPRDAGPTKVAPFDKKKGPHDGALLAHEDKPTPPETPPAPPPPPAAPEVPPGIDAEVYFGLNGASIVDPHALASPVDWLKAHADVHANIDGFADPTGSTDQNQVLSERRAEAVRDYLVAHGIDSARLEVRAFGDTTVKYGKTDARNRRVEIEAK